MRLSSDVNCFCLLQRISIISCELFLFVTEERRLEDNERVLWVQLNWGTDVREGRFLLKREVWFMGRGTANPRATYVSGERAS